MRTREEEGGDKELEIRSRIFFELFRNWGKSDSQKKDTKGGTMIKPKKGMSVSLLILFEVLSTGV